MLKLLRPLFNEKIYSKEENLYRGEIRSQDLVTRGQNTNALHYGIHAQQVTNSDDWAMPSAALTALRVRCCRRPNVNLTRLQLHQYVSHYL